MTANQRLKEALDYLKKEKIIYNQQNFVDKMGSHSSVVSEYITGKRLISEKFARKINEVFSMVSDQWLLTGEGKMITDDPEVPYSSGKSDKITTIPYFPDVNASAGLDFLADNGHNYSIPINIPNVDAEAFINVFGDSMYPKYCSGEIIGIKAIGKDMVFFGPAYVIQMIDGEAYIKYIDPGKDDDHWILRSENPAYKPKQFHLEKIRKVYIIKAVISKITIL